MEQITNFENQNLDQNLTPITPQKNIFKILFFILLALVLVITSVLITLLVTKNKSQLVPQSSEETQTLSVSPTAIPTTDPTAGWKTYENKEIGLNFKYPSKLSFLNKIENGTLLITVNNKYGFAGGNNAITGVTTERGGGFYDVSGYSKKDNEIYGLYPGVKLIQTTPIDNRNIKKIYTNPNGVEIVIINDTSKFSPGGDEEDYNDFTKYGNTGALVNTKNKTYPGLAFTINPDISSSDFLKILDTFKFN